MSDKTSCGKIQHCQIFLFFPELLLTLDLETGSKKRDCLDAPGMQLQIGSNDGVGHCRDYPN